MLTLSIVDAKKAGSDAQLYAYVMQESESMSSTIKKIEKKHAVILQPIVKQQQFKGRVGDVLVLPYDVEGVVQYISLIGLGSVGNGINGKIDIETYRRAIGRMIRIAESRKIDSISFELPSAALCNVSLNYLFEQTVIAAHMAAYKYDRFLTNSESKVRDIAVEIVVPTAHKLSLKNALRRAEIIARAVNQAREWVDAPPELLTPPELAREARVIAKKYDVKITVFDEKKIKQMGMGGLEAVSRGSDLDCQLVIMEYSCGKKRAPTLGLVGKGITFDSGGLSIKPAQSMETMKEDMSGAAAVIAAMQAIAQPKPNVNVVVAAALSENLPSGKATKPGDIVTFYNGKTAEVRNTDAEGRLVLADALAYVVEQYKLDALVDIATLTGACAYAIGPFFTGLMSQHDALSHTVQDSAARSGDRVWPLPLNDDYKVAIKSTIADICNIGNKRYNAGAITAGFFLQNFVGNVPWVHLDIAGTAFDVPDISYYRPGATGVGVRLLIDMACNWKEK